MKKLSLITVVVGMLMSQIAMAGEPCPLLHSASAGRDVNPKAGLTQTYTQSASTVQNAKGVK